MNKKVLVTGDAGAIGFRFKVNRTAELTKTIAFYAPELAPHGINEI